MKKNDIKPGIIYAYQRGRGDLDTPVPIVFLAAPADGTLYTKASNYRKPGDAQYTQVTYPNAKPSAGRGYGSRDIGYPAVQINWGHESEVSPQNLLKVTLADFEQATTSYDPGIAGMRLTLVTSLAAITGPYEEKLAEYNARQDAIRRQREQEKAERDVILTRAENIVSRFTRFAVTPGHAGTGGTQPHVRFTLDDAEKLLNLLGTALLLADDDGIPPVNAAADAPAPWESDATRE